MNVVKLELSKKLYELSEWSDTSNTWMKHSLSDKAKCYAIPTAETGIQVLNGELEYKYPAYDLGYLLRKLPKEYRTHRSGKKTITSREIQLEQWGNQWMIGLGDGDKEYLEAKADTPEDALCLLAITLFESGILTKGEEE